MNEEVRTLLDKFKEDPMMLDTLYQWATAPTGTTAVLDGFPPDHGLIKSNLKIRYNLNDKKVNEIYNEFKGEIESIGFDFLSGFLEAEVEVKEYFDESDVLKNEVLQRLKSAPDNEKFIVWLFCKVKDNYETWSSERDYGTGREALKRFWALLNATFNIHATMAEVYSILIKLGFVNELEWIRSSKKHNRTRNFILPDYLQSVAEDIDEYISLPELPDFRKLIDILFEKKRVGTLIAIEELLEHGWIKTEEITGNIIPYTSIIGKEDNVFALNLRIYEPLRDYFFEKKNNELKITDKLSKILGQLSEKHYPDISFEDKRIFGGAQAWDIHTIDNLLSEKDIRIIHTPWLTGQQMNILKNEDSNKYTVLLSTMEGIPELNKVYRKAFGKDIDEEDFDWIILDSTKDKIYEKIINKKPELYNEIINEFKKEYLFAERKELEPKDIDISFKETEKPKQSADIFTDEHTQSSESNAIISVSAKHSETQNDLPEPSVPSTKSDLSILLGKEKETNIFWKPGKLNNGHFIIIGGCGAGKTETIRCIASELMKQSYPVLMIDFHGDMAPSDYEIQSYEIKENGNYYFNPFELSETFEEITPLRATSDFIDAASINFPGFGIQQKDRLKEIIKNAYDEAGITNDTSTWQKELPFKKIEDEIKTSDDKTTQSVKAYLGDIFDYKLFSAKNKISIEQIFKDGITHIQLQKLPENLRSLYADLLLRKLYYSLQALGDIPQGEMTSDRQKFRMFVIVDEAKLLVSQNQGTKAVLNKYATELRKYGVGLILASQMIEHFNDEILSNIALKLCMKAETKKQAKVNSKFFGTDDTSLLNLKCGEGISISNDKKIKIIITPTWDRK